jgi:hypothetical protein
VTSRAPARRADGPSAIAPPFGFTPRIVVRDAEVAQHREALGRERLVEFDDVDLVDAQASRAPAASASPGRGRCP